MNTQEICCVSFVFIHSCNRTQVSFYSAAILFLFFCTNFTFHYCFGFAQYSSPLLFDRILFLSSLFPTVLTYFFRSPHLQSSSLISFVFTVNIFTSHCHSLLLSLSIILIHFLSYFSFTFNQPQLPLCSTFTQFSLSSLSVALIPALPNILDLFSFEVFFFQPFPTKLPFLCCFLFTDYSPFSMSFLFSRRHSLSLLHSSVFFHESHLPLLSAGTQFSPFRLPYLFPSLHPHRKPLSILF